MAASAPTVFTLQGVAQGKQAIAWGETLELGDSNVSAQGRISALCGLMEYAENHAGDTNTVFRVVLQLFASDRFVTKKAAGMLTETCNARAGKGRISQPQSLGPVIINLTELVKLQSNHYTATTQSDPGTQNFFAYLRSDALPTAGFADILGRRKLIRVPVPVTPSATIPAAGKEYLFRSSNGGEFLNCIWGDKMAPEIWYADGLLHGKPQSIMAEKMSGYGKIFVAQNTYVVMGEYKDGTDYYTSRWPNMGLGTTQFEFDVLSFEEHKLTLAQRATTFARLTPTQQVSQNSDWGTHNHNWQRALWAKLRPKQTSYAIRPLGQWKKYTKEEIETPMDAVLTALANSYSAPESFDISQLPNAINVTQNYLNAIFPTSDSRQALATAMNKAAENRTLQEKEMVKKHVDILPTIKNWRNIQTALKSAPTSFALSAFNCDEKTVTLPTDPAALGDVTHEIASLAGGRKVAMGITTNEEMKGFLERSIFLQTAEVEASVRELRDGLDALAPNADVVEPVPVEEEVIVP